MQVHNLLDWLHADRDAARLGKRAAGSVISASRITHRARSTDVASVMRSEKARLRADQLRCLLTAMPNSAPAAREG